MLKGLICLHIFCSVLWFMSLVDLSRKVAYVYFDEALAQESPKLEVTGYKFQTPQVVNFKACMAYATFVLLLIM